MTKPETPPPPAVGSPLDGGVGRPLPERDIFDHEHGDADWLDDDDLLECHNCHGDGMDPGCDYLLPCPVCQCERRP